MGSPAGYEGVHRSGQPGIQAREGTGAACRSVCHNRENVEWLVDYYRNDWPFDMVVIDESSSFKDQSTKRWKALKRVRPKIHRIVLLTGTPAPNTLIDLWAQLYLLDEGARLGRTIGGFRERYFQPDKRNAERVFTYKPKMGTEQAVRISSGTSASA